MNIKEWNARASVRARAQHLIKHETKQWQTNTNEISNENEEKDKLKIAYVSTGIGCFLISPSLSL